MTDYRLVMSLLLQDRSYRDIEAIAGCSHRTIAKAKKVCHDHGLTATSQVGVFPLKWPLQLSGEFVYVSES